MTQRARADHPSRRLVRPLVIAAVVAAVAFSVTLLPRGYDTDLSQVGAGRAALVIVHDPNIVQSGNLMHALDRVRDEFEERLRFLVADQNLGDGRAFAAMHDLRAATLALFGADGDLLDVYADAGEPEPIRVWLSEHVFSGVLR